MCTDHLHLFAWSHTFVHVFLMSFMYLCLFVTIVTPTVMSCPFIYYTTMTENNMRTTGSNYKWQVEVMETRWETAWEKVMQRSQNFSSTARFEHWPPFFQLYQTFYPSFTSTAWFEHVPPFFNMYCLFSTSTAHCSPPLSIQPILKIYHWSFTSTA